MKRILLSLAAALGCLACAAQTVVCGTVSDSQSGEPLAYVNIGVIGTPTGCIADGKGNFTLTVPEGMDRSERIRISMISYEPVTMSVGDFLTLGSYSIRLTPKHTVLKELVVTPSKYKRRTLGTNFSGSGGMMYARDTTRGFEIGVLFDIKRPSLLETVSVIIGRNEYEMLTFRINIYKRTGEAEFENILATPIYGYCPRTDEPVYVDVDVLEHNIVLEGEVLVALQHVEDDNHGRVFFPTSLTGTTSFGRRASEDVWTQRFVENQSIKPKVPLTITVREKH